MRHFDQKTTDAVVLAALEQHASRVLEVEPGAWDVGLANGRVHRGSARARSGWLTLEIELPGGVAPDDPWALLHLNARTGASVKFALDATGRTPRLLGELPLDLDDPSRLQEHVGSLLARVKDASAGDRLKKKVRAEARRCATPAVGPTSVARCVEAAGWPFTERSETCVAVPLEVRRRVTEAVVEPTAEGGLIVSAKLPDGAAPPAGANRDALAVLLLVVSGSVRLVRAAAVAQPGSEATTRLETALAPAAAAQHLHHALAALSVGCRMCALEAALLHDDAVVAKTYLGSRDGLGAHVDSDSRRKE